jgi:hypothetical protein
VAQAFDFGGIGKTWGAPSFALFAKGGNTEPMRNRALRRMDKSYLGSIAAHPCKKRKDGAPSVEMLHAEGR